VPDPRPLRLAIYTDATGLGGAEQSVRNLLAELGLHVAADVLGVDREVVEWIAAGRPGTGTRVVPPVRNKFDVGAIAAHVRAVRELRPNVLQANLRTTFSCQYGILAGLITHGVRVVAVEQLPISGAVWFERLHTRIASRRLAAHVAVGVRVARLVEEAIGLPIGSVRTIHNGVPDTHPASVPRTQNGPVVGSLGRLVEQKRFDVLVRALASLEGVTAVIVGGGPERPALEELAAALDVSDRLVITGWTADARSYLPTFDVFVLPSDFEGFPLSIPEAMLAGLPIVATDVGSVAEAVSDGETGLLVQRGDADAVAAALRLLLNDAELRRRMGERGRAIAAQHFTASAMARSYEALYEEIRR
jgi:glycosyltransferase involved in cell wall biosynthesis